MHTAINLPNTRRLDQNTSHRQQKGERNTRHQPPMRAQSATMNAPSQDRASNLKTDLPPKKIAQKSRPLKYNKRSALLTMLATKLKALQEKIDHIKFTIFHTLPWLDFIIRFSLVLLPVVFILQHTIPITALIPNFLPTYLAFNIFTWSICISTHVRIQHYLKLPKLLSYLLFITIALVPTAITGSVANLAYSSIIALITPKHTKDVLSNNPLSPIIITPLLTSIICTPLILVLPQLPFWPLVALVSLATHIVLEYLHIRKLAPEQSTKTLFKLIFGHRDNCIHPRNYILLCKDNAQSRKTNNNSILLDTSQLLDAGTNEEERASLRCTLNHKLAGKATIASNSEDIWWQVTKNKAITLRECTLFHPDRHPKHKDLYSHLFGTLSSNIAKNHLHEASPSGTAYLVKSELKSKLKAKFDSIIGIHQAVSLESSTMLLPAIHYITVCFIRITIKLTNGRNTMFDLLLPNQDKTKEAQLYSKGALIVGTRMEPTTINMLRKEFIDTPPILCLQCPNLSSGNG